MDWSYLFTSFEGRISRQPFWLATLVLWIASLVLSILAGLLVGPGGIGSILVQFIIGLVFLVPSLAVAAKRYHDRDKSGWWILILFIPIVGFIQYIIDVGFLPGTPGPNRFGPDPLSPPMRRA